VHPVVRDSMITRRFWDILYEFDTILISRFVYTMYRSMYRSMYPFNMYAHFIIEFGDFAILAYMLKIIYMGKMWSKY